MKATGLAAALVIAGSVTTAAQELEPRSYSPSPIGTIFVIGGSGRSQGAILLDPSLDVDNVEGDLWIATSGIGRVFGLAGRQARALAVVPVAWGAIAGDVRGEAQQQHLAGLVDPRFKFTIGLRGAPALTPADFARAPRRVIVGASVTVMPPLPRRTWIAFNGTWFAGGQTRVERVDNPDEQRNSRLGATFSVPIAARQSLKFVYSTGATTRRGSDFNTFNITWQLVTF